MPAGAPLLSLEGVSKVQRDGRRSVTVLDEVAFSVAAGERVGIRGARRAGKTTLLRIAAGIDAPSGGVVRWRGVDMARASPRDRAGCLREIGFAPATLRSAQRRPVVDHVTLPLLIDGLAPRAATLRALAALERVGAGEHADAAPDELAPGASTRVAIALAVVRGPRLLIVDEPGAAPARTERDEVSALLAGLVREQGFALLVAAREASSLHGCDRLLSLRDGRLREHERPLAPVVPLHADGWEGRDA